MTLRTRRTSSGTPSSSGAPSHLSVIPDILHRPHRKLTSSVSEVDHPYFPPSQVKHHTTATMLDEVGKLQCLLPDATDQQRIEHQISRNILAARRSRQAKKRYVKHLEEAVQQLTVERDKWKTRAEMLRNNAEEETLEKLPADVTNLRHGEIPATRTFRKDLEETVYQLATVAEESETKVEIMMSRDNDGKEEKLQELPPDATDQQRIERQCYRNTLAARRSRQQMKLYVQQLGENVQQLTGEADEWKTRAKMFRGTLESQGLEMPCPEWSD
ncbi:hypothetical protein E1B28_008420 [Marasmius oreades]|uniref:BZIP domain-containing protein n=1 Tax=Marasmius oreades TaxID=181124 RepID=A0A9P7RYH8_9AGAR|nr:uncharacterized protein E1B28_008420 [Marasmius oreades]KAG7092039.1 hypothetical protein E1B28_008420 [Marasmius oreades]